MKKKKKSEKIDKHCKQTEACVLVKVKFTSGLVSLLNGISTFMGYLMLRSFLSKDGNGAI